MNISRHPIIIVVSRYCFFSLFRAFCMRHRKSIPDEIGTAVLPVVFASISRLKSPYKPTVQRVCTRVTVGMRFAICSGAKNILVCI